MRDMRHLPNAISVLRIAGSFGLLFCDVAGWLFWALYALCGISDMVDGPLARKLQSANRLTGFLLFLTVPTMFLLFLTVPTMFWSMIPVSIVAALATFAAVQEGHLIRTEQVF